ncbi:lysophospholipid acyltransferase family protein [Desulfobulbus rhabdoformis]|uniref:lysophospholipid acyltransferase family protein n=1 Tax=Desulfobulbus rhabdoformis TaxID=34032 RepID=UPI001F06AE96|nr:lysophospholipid acyltransferase family protein [Desulfobulbus rhabdoformis]
MMRIDPYTFLVHLSLLLGTWFFTGVARFIALGYFLFSPRVKESRRFYGLVFPQRSRWFHIWCTFRQYQNFTTIHVDRFLNNRGLSPTYTATGAEALYARSGQGGALLLMSHLGNWEMAARMLMCKSQKTALLLYMGIKEKEGVERRQKQELQQAGVSIIGVDQGKGSPFTAVEGLRVLRQGGFVSMTGDVSWREDQRQIPVNILGHRAYVAEAPFVFALVSGAPIIVFFAFRTGRNRYHFTFSAPIWVTSKSREQRHRVIVEAAQQYAHLLESALLAHPCEWYHFERFFHDPNEFP